MATGPWGQPEYGDGDPMDGDGQTTLTSRYARDVGVRHFASQALLNLATGMLDGYLAVVDTIRGASFVYDGVGLAWIMHGTPRFATSTARDAAITAPVAGMLSRIDTERFVRRYNGTTWRPYGSDSFPLIPASVAGSGVTLGADGAITIASGATALDVSVNDVFPTTDDFDDYDITYTETGASAAHTVSIALRASGADSATGYDDVGMFGQNGAAGSSAPLNAASIVLAGSQYNTVEIGLKRPHYNAQTLVLARSLGTPNPGTLAAMVVQEFGSLHRASFQATGFTIKLTGSATGINGVVRVSGRNSH